MLDRIQGGQTEQVGQSSSLDKVKEIDSRSHVVESDSDYIVDESEISDAAYKKYERELDVAKFSKILLESDEDEANALVMKNAFDGKLSLDSDDYLGDLLTNSDLLNDIT